MLVWCALYMVETWKGFINGITDRGEKDLGNSLVFLYSYLFVL